MTTPDLPILHLAERYFAIDKPEGYFVHPPERSPYPVAPEKICLYALREKFRASVFPVHRLDAATSGIVLFALDKDATRALNAKFAERDVDKTYRAVARGFVNDEGVIDLPLEIAGFEKKMESETRYRAMARRELPHTVGRYPTARYSLLEVKPVTGRWHQIRRHFDRIAHPLIGDVEHGDSHHNRFFRDTLEIRGLCLRAEALSFDDPWSGKRVEIRAPTNDKWSRIQKIFNVPEAP